MARPLSVHELDTMRNGGGIHVNLIPGSTVFDRADAIGIRANHSTAP